MQRKKLTDDGKATLLVCQDLYTKEKQLSHLNKVDLVVEKVCIEMRH